MNITISVFASGQKDTQLNKELKRVWKSTEDAFALFLFAIRHVDYKLK